MPFLQPNQQCQSTEGIRAEIQKAINQMSNGKAPGTDGIPAEVFKKCSSCLLPHLIDLFEAIWNEATVPRDFKDATLVHIYKRKGDRSCCDHHRGISLLSTAGKILARVLLIPESQCGFRAGRGTTDMIFAARQIQKKCREQNRDLYMVFIDLTKAFDSVNKHVRRELDCTPTLACINTDYDPGSVVSTAQSNNNNSWLKYCGV